jgi:hypothetical protein
MVFLLVEHDSINSSHFTHVYKINKYNKTPACRAATRYNTVLDKVSEIFAALSLFMLFRRGELA